MNLQAVLVTGRVSHVRVVASEMPDQEVAHPSQGGLPVGEPGRDPQLGDCHYMGYVLLKPRWKCIVPRAEWY